MRLLTFLCAVLVATSTTAQPKNYVLSTAGTSIVLRGEPGGKLTAAYYGTRIDNESELESSGTMMNAEAYPGFGRIRGNTYALQVVHADGDATLDLVFESHEQTTGESPKNAPVTGSTAPEKHIFTLKDRVYPITVKLIYTLYRESDIIAAHTEIAHNEKGDVRLDKYASALVPLREGRHWLTRFDGAWAGEWQMSESEMHRGVELITNRDGARNSQTTVPSFMISLDQKPAENSGRVVAGTLAWSGNYNIAIEWDGHQDIGVHNPVRIVAGMAEQAANYFLKPKENFVTPDLLITFSTEGKGGASRNLHRWARQWGVAHGNVDRKILLNSWEGVYFKVDEQVMRQMMTDFAAIGGELFVMDDGWFGGKYPRDNDKTSLGDWQVASGKLPHGVEGLVKDADSKGIRFGIWIEPEAANVLSELYERHPDWVLRNRLREPVMGRGGGQMLLDMCNPAVQEHVFKVVDDLMTSNPRIDYIKWDANVALNNYGSAYLAKDRQTHLYIDYHRGLMKTLERIRAAHPNVAIQACAGGGGRINYGLMPYFDECWPSDDTDALQRIYMQWGMTHFFPAITMASHISAAPNHQTGRVLPLKYRADVAMSGRLGMEMKPSSLNENDRKQAERAIADYKKVRRVVQQGDLYRLISPYSGEQRASLIYVFEGEAVFFAWNMVHTQLTGQDVVFRMAGLDPAREYVVEELNPAIGGRALPFEGRRFSGKFLMDIGLRMPLTRDWASVVLRVRG